MLNNFILFCFLCVAGNLIAYLCAEKETERRTKVPPPEPQFEGYNLFFVRKRKKA